MTQPRVELLFWDGCPSHPEALASLRAAMADVGLDPDTVLVREVDTGTGIAPASRAVVPSSSKT